MASCKTTACAGSSVRTIEIYTFKASGDDASEQGRVK